MLCVFYALCVHNSKALVLATLQTSVTIKLHSVTGIMCNAGNNATLISEYNRATIMDGSKKRNEPVYIQ